MEASWRSNAVAEQATPGLAHEARARNRALWGRMSHSLPHHSAVCLVEQGCIRVYERFPIGSIASCAESRSLSGAIGDSFGDGGVCYCVYASRLIQMALRR
jgi:hypothetical protein